MLTLPYGRCPELRARDKQQSARLPEKQNCAAASCGTRGRKYLPRTQIVAVDRTVEAAESHGAMRGDASALAALEGRRGEQSYGTFVTAPR